MSICFFYRRVTLSSLFAVLVCLFTLNVVAGYENVEDIPNPRLNSRWVVDLTGTIEQRHLDRVNNFCESIHQSNNAQMAVVVVRTTGDKSVEDFATQLFNLWGIGHAKKNDGILFLVAKNDRKMRIALGSGIDGMQEESIAQEILDNEVTPRFRAGEFGEGLYAGTFSTAIRILTMAEDEFVDGFQKPAVIEKPDVHDSPIANVNQKQNQNHGARNQRRGTSPAIPFLIGAGALGFGGLSFVGGRYWLRYRKRNCNHCGNEMVLLEEAQDDQFLDPSEQTEERIGSVDYDVWACLQCEDVQKFRYGKFFSRYSKCPKCRYKTKFDIKNTMVAATTNHGGRVHVEENCVNCSYHHERYYSTPKLSDNSSNNSSSSFSGGGGSSGSSGFGGGSSSGGGATGGW